jgi:hypothetical protein
MGLRTHLGGVSVREFASRIVRLENSVAPLLTGVAGAHPKGRGKRPTIQIAGILPNATQTCPKCVTGNVLCLRN